ncbi:MAG: hypothetical protein GEV03_00520 [Streptosporangiales bacterium]|nr:hypothetical protein [Streptosporangiales bacterium]
MNSSVGAWKKLERIRRNPRVAIAFHTREHGSSGRPEYVLVQGEASLTPASDQTWLRTNREHWERFYGSTSEFGPFWGWWLRIYHWRVGIEIAVERVIVWPDLTCRGTPEVHGAPLPADGPELTPPAPQRRPARGTEPRIDHVRAAAGARRLPDVLLGWMGAEGFPVVAPIRVAGTAERGIVLDVPERLVPPGGRRAGLTAHWFGPRNFGQQQRIHTGWLETEPGEPGEPGAIYAPHTEVGHRIPRSKLLYRLAVGLGTRLWLRQARRAGALPGEGIAEHSGRVP